MKSKNDRQGNIVKTKHISRALDMKYKKFNLIKRCDSVISMDISTGWLKSNIHTWISISTASLVRGASSHRPFSAEQLIGLWNELLAKLGFMLSLIHISEPTRPY